MPRRRLAAVTVSLLLLLLLVVAVSCGAPVAPGPIVTDPEPQAPCEEARMAENSYLTSVSANGRYFEDQRGNPLLVLGDSPWAGLTRWSPDQAELYFADREAHGFNAAIISLVGAKNNGGPDDDGRTFDGVLPFHRGDITRWNEPYWLRVDQYLRSACAHGITVFLYPIDGWNVGGAFRNATPEDARRYGAMVATRYRNFPNIVWMTGGDHFPQDAPGQSLQDAPGQESSPAEHDAMFEQVLLGIRSTGDKRSFSIQLGYPTSLSTDSPRWERYVDWNFVYTYLPTYRAVLDAYGRAGGRDPRPALLGEANYEGENNLPGTPVTTDEILRRQMLWAMTSGSPGYFYGSDDWEFHPGWERRLDTPAVAQLRDIQQLFASFAWWELVPDQSSEVITAGRGYEAADGAGIGILQNDYLTAARTTDGSLVAYVPTARTVGVDRTRLSSSTARWIDPASATAPPIEVEIGPAGALTTPGRNSAGGQDWLLVLRLQR